MIPPFDADDIDVRSPRYLIASTLGRCTRCGRSTLLVALCLPPGHEVLDQIDDIWCAAERHAFLFHVDNLCPSARQRLRAIAPRYDVARSTEEGSGWLNHCDHCGSSFDDDAMFCEPDGGFLPTSAQSAALIRLMCIDEAIEARAAGIADEPEFFAFMRRD